MEKKGIVLALIMILPVILLGTTYLATTAQEIQNYTNLLQAGDTLLVQEGTYGLNWNISDRYGTDNDWIVIHAINNNAVINGVNYDNVIDVYNSHYVELKGFEITNSYGGSGIDGIKFRTTSDHLLMEDLHIHDITGVGISANPTGQTWSYLIIRHCHLHDITDVGEGLYIGNHDGLSSVHHCLVELNWIHDCHPHKGIQFKRGTYLNIIQDNVVYNCDEAGIVLYKTDQASPSDNNIVRRNVVWNAPEGIFAVGQTNIDNNVVFNCDYGLNVRNYSSWGMNDLYIRNNTIYHCSTTCLRLDDWNSASGEMIAINNACYQDSIGQSAIQVPDGLGPGITMNNRHYGQSQTSGSTQGKPPNQEFINPSVTPGLVDFYPLNSSSLIDSGTSNYGAPNDDFNFFARPFNGLWDVGAYEWSQNTNPGWVIHEDYKEIIFDIAEKKRTRTFQNPCYTVISTKMVVWKNLSRGDIIKLYCTSGRIIHNSGIIPGNTYELSTEQVSGGVYFFTIQRSTSDAAIQGKLTVIK